MKTQPYCLPHVAAQNAFAGISAKGRFAGKKRHRSTIRLVFRPAFRRPQSELPGNAGEDRRRRLRRDTGRKPSLGGSDPL